MSFVYPFFWLLHTVLDIYKWLVIVAAIVSLLIAFRVLDTRNRLVWTVADFLYRATEPALRPIRRFMPDLGGIDLSPLVLILLLQFSQMMLSALYLRLAQAMI